MNRYVIKKGNRYWKKHNNGYSSDIKEARIFTKDQAVEIINRPNSDKTMHEV